MCKIQKVVLTETNVTEIQLTWLYHRTEIGIVYFGGSTHFLHFRSFSVAVQDDRKMYNGKDGVYGCKVRINVVSEIYKVPVTIYFVSEGQISEPPIVIVDQVVTKRKRIKREVWWSWFLTSSWWNFNRSQEQGCNFRFTEILNTFEMRS